ncbi:Ger(x)C family spore germination protein [Fictibacillus nanhaiensis]|uniref:Ger(X)C family spore germination protein n=1 Tax=Fictibacillus nanhaiensis TaxID=742169 RepID=A0ABS2ZSE0_9BACL|nr:Ger(x)C family spore germination protein [Fictibacillus nanhaiensis]
MNRTPFKSRWYLPIFCLFLLTGCWDNKDINHRVLPLVVGVKKIEDDRYKIILEIPTTNPNGIQTEIVTGTGDTINEAIEQIKTNLESQVDLLHLRLIVLDKEYANSGTEELIEAIMRTREISPKAMVAVCSNDSLEDFFSGVNEKVQTSNISMLDFFDKTAGWTPQIVTANTWEMYRGIHSPTQDVTLPVIDKGKDTTLVYKGSAIFHKGAMKGKITGDDSFLINAYKGNETYGKIEVLNKASVMVVSNRIQNYAEIKGDLPFLTIKMNLNVVVLETVGNPSVNDVKKQLDDLITTRFQNVIQKSQSEQSDTFGFGQHFRSLLPPNQLTTWKTDYYPRLKVKVDVKVDIRNKGNLKSMKGN